MTSSGSVPSSRARATSRSIVAHRPTAALGDTGRSDLRKPTALGLPSRRFRSRSASALTGAPSASQSGRPRSSVRTPRALRSRPGRRLGDEVLRVRLRDSDRAPAPACPLKGGPCARQGTWAGAPTLAAEGRVVRSHAMRAVAAPGPLDEPGFLQVLHRVSCTGRRGVRFREPGQFVCACRRSGLRLEKMGLATLRRVGNLRGRRAPLARAVECGVLPAGFGGHGDQLREGLWGGRVQGGLRSGGGDGARGRPPPPGYGRPWRGLPWYKSTLTIRAEEGGEVFTDRVSVTVVPSAGLMRWEDGLLGDPAQRERRGLREAHSRAYAPPGEDASERGRGRQAAGRPRR